MKRIEHGTGGTVTMGAVRAGGPTMLEVVVYPAVLRTLPWYRGGMTVATLVLPYGGGKMEVARAGLDGPHRLLARVATPTDKLPPVQLRVPALPFMLDEERTPEAVAFEVWPTVLMLTLPSWARRAPQVAA